MSLLLTALQLMQVAATMRKQLQRDSVGVRLNGLGKILPEVGDCRDKPVTISGQFNQRRGPRSR